MLEKIIEAVKECGAILKNAEIHDVALKNNDRRNLVTEYDVKIQSVLKEKLKSIFPSASFLGEEGVQEYEKNGWCFVCDPIDGTTNFVKKMNFSCISVALLKDGKPVIGVIYNPYANELFCAEKGKGATLNGQRIYTTSENLKNSLVAFGTGVYDLLEIDSVFDYARKCFKAAVDVRRSGSAALDLCSIACARTGYFFEMRLSPWDFAAGVLIVQEAGGIIKSKNFQDIDDYFQAQSVFAFGNEKIFEDAKKIKKI